MRLIFCTDPWNTPQPDAMYATEVLAAELAGFSYSLINFEALVDQSNVQRAVRKVEMASSKEIAYYRGWMLKPEIYRLFFRDGQLILTTAYWGEGDYGNDSPPLALFTKVAQQVQSRFFTMDVAKCLDGSWMIVELGDGQVAGLPEQTDIAAFYVALAATIHI